MYARSPSYFRCVRADGVPVLFVAALALYATVMVPGLHLLSPLNEEVPLYLSILKNGTAIAADREVLVGVDRSESVTIIAASGLLIMGLLIGVVLLQGGDWYSQKVYREELEADARKKLAKAKAQ